MKLHVNGKPYEHTAGRTIGTLLPEIGAFPDKVAVLLNDNVVKRAEWQNKELKDGDRIEILMLAAGG
ncbi:MAG: sulfur carrier protein ThiS [Lentisphaerae bacterium]|nr:sulfur carrier protein ThiS [Lentisphaerota bacterium]